MIFYEEYARAGAPGRLGHIGETLLGPTLIAFGSDAQKRRFLPPIVAGEEIWCQGYSEPNAGSDLANVQTRARLDGGEWVIDGQKVWTSWAAVGRLVLRRRAAPIPRSKRHQGLSYLLVPMKQPGVEIRPILQITGDAEFSEVFFDGARTARRTSSARPATAGRSRWARSPSSAAPRRSASRCCSRTSSTEIIARREARTARRATR